MKKIILLIGAITILSLTGCNSSGKLETAENAESLQQEVDSSFLFQLVKAEHGIAYTADGESSNYIISDELIQELCDNCENIQISEQEREKGSEINAKVMIEIYEKSESGYDILFTFFVHNNNLYIDKGWNDNGNRVYQKLRSDKLTEWLNQLQEESADVIEKEQW